MPAFPERSDIQLAQPLTEKNILTISYQGMVLAQPKLNGERCRVSWFAEEPYLISSYGNEFKFCSRIRQDLLNKTKHLNLPRLLLDGEIYKHGWTRERIDSALRRKKNYNPEVEELEFHIFDIQDPEKPQYERLGDLLQLQQQDFFTGPLVLVPTASLHIDNWMGATREYVLQGYEGLIARNPLSKYSFRRTPNMLKFKPTEKDEYIIVSFEEGEGWCQGMLGAFIVQGDDGTQFAVGTGPELTKEKRQRYWAMRNILIGKTLIVKHESMKTSGGIPLCTVAFELKL